MIEDIECFVEELGDLLYKYGCEDVANLYYVVDKYGDVKVKIEYRNFLEDEVFVEAGDAVSVMLEVAEELMRGRRKIYET